MAELKNVNAAVAAARETFGPIHILVNNAGIWRDVAGFSEASTDLWRKYLDVNLMGTVHFTKAVIDEMTDNGYGRIINVASVAGVYGNAKMSFYSATKGAVISLTKALAKEVTGLGVTVNAVSPGSVSPAEQADIDYTQPSTLSFAGRTGSCRRDQPHPSDHRAGVHRGAAGCGDSAADRLEKEEKVNCKVSPILQGSGCALEDFVL